MADKYMLRPPQAITKDSLPVAEARRLQEEWHEKMMMPVLRLIDSNPGITTRQIRDALKLNSQTVAARVYALEQDGEVRGDRYQNTIKWTHLYPGFDYKAPEPDDWPGNSYLHEEDGWEDPPWAS